MSCTTHVFIILYPSVSPTCRHPCLVPPKESQTCSQGPLSCGWSWVQQGPLERSCEQICIIPHRKSLICNSIPVSWYDGFPWRSDKLVLNFLQFVDGLGFSEHHRGIPVWLEMEILGEPRSGHISTGLVILGPWSLPGQTWSHLLLCQGLCLLILGAHLCSLDWLALRNGSWLKIIIGENCKDNPIRKKHYKPVHYRKSLLVCYFC